MRRLQAGCWDGAADALAAEWSWNPLLRNCPVPQIRQCQAALRHVQGPQADGPPLVPAAAAW
jgi:hypothetical protein